MIWLQEKLRVLVMFNFHQIVRGFIVLTLLIVLWDGSHSSLVPQVTPSDVCSGAFDEMVNHTIAGRRYCKFNCYPVKTSQEHQQFCANNCQNYNKCIVQSIYLQCVKFDREIAIGNVVTSCGSACVADPWSEVCTDECTGVRQCYIDTGWKLVGALSHGQHYLNNSWKSFAVNTGCQGAAEEIIDHPITGRQLCRDQCPPIKSSDEEIYYCSSNCKQYSRCIFDSVVAPCLQFDSQVLYDNYMTPCSVVCVKAPASQLCLHNCSTMVSCYRQMCLSLAHGNSSAAASIGRLCTTQSPTFATQTSDLHFEAATTRPYFESGTSVSMQITTPSNATTNTQAHVIITAVVVPIVVIAVLAVSGFIIWKRRCSNKQPIVRQPEEDQSINPQPPTARPINHAFPPDEFLLNLKERDEASSA